MITLKANEKLRLNRKTTILRVEKGSLDLFGVSKKDELFSFYLGNFQDKDAIFDIGLNIDEDFYLELRSVEESSIIESNLLESCLQKKKICKPRSPPISKKSYRSSKEREKRLKKPFSRH